METQFVTVLGILRGQRERIDAAIAALERLEEIDPRPAARQAERKPRKLRAAQRKPKATPPPAKSLRGLIKKTCSKCGQEKSLEEFPVLRSRPDGHDFKCAECKRAYMRGYQTKRNAPAIDIPEDLTCKLCHSPCSTEGRYRHHMATVHGKAA